MICNECKHESINMFCGQSFTDWKCQVCGKTFTHCNTATPKVCKECSEKYNLCEECGKEIKTAKDGE